MHDSSSAPSSGHKELERLVGTWKGVETLAPSPFDPKGGTAEGVVENRLDLGGYFVIQNYVQTRAGKQSFSGHGVFGFDPRTEQYSLHWFGSIGMAPDHFRGRLEDGILTLHNPDGMLPARATFDVRETDSYGFKMEITMDGSTWHTFMSGTYKRS